MRANIAVCATLIIASIPLRVHADVLDSFLFAENEKLENHLQLPTPSSSPWIADPEIRVSPEVDLQNRHNESYRFRFRPTSRRERNSQRELMRIENQIATANWQRSLGKVLADRYHAVIDLAEHEVTLVLAKQQAELDRNSIVSEQLLSASSDFSATRLQNAALRLELREERASMVGQIVAEMRSATVGHYLAGSPGSASISTKLIGPTEVARILDTLRRMPAARAYGATLVHLELRRAKQEYELEKSRTNFGLDLLELGYQNNNTDSYNVTLGFRLPFGKRSNSPTRRSRDIAIARSQAYLTEQMLKSKLENISREIHWKIADYHRTQVAIKNTDGRLGGTSGELASAILLQRHRIELLGNAADVHVSILRNLVELLGALDLLQQRPSKNWIKRDSS